MILTGTSAGGIAALTWSDYVYNRMLNPEGLIIAPDSGIMIFDYTNPFTGEKPIVENTN